LVKVESISPVPRPSGTDSKQKKKSESIAENPIRIIAINTVVTADTKAVPNLPTSLEAIRLDKTVPSATQENI
jgi:hypothetical protein